MEYSKPHRSVPNAQRSLSEVVRAHWRLLLIILFTSCGLHLVKWGSPPSVVFDEVHFGKYVTAYAISSERIFDIHPPHSKLLIAGLGWIGGYREPFPFKTIGDRFEANRGVLALRWMPTLWGVLIPIAVFVLLSQWGVSTVWALTGSAFALFDNGILLQTRIIALDGCLLLASCLAAIFAFESAFESKLRMRVLYALLSGVAAAFAVGTKYTGLVVPVLSMGILSLPFRRVWDRKRVKGLFQLVAVFSGGFLVIYIVGWWLHFHLLTQPGYNDRFYPWTDHFWVDFVQLQRVMLSANAGIKTGHPDSSLWWQWPLGVKQLFYWSDGDARIYFAANPFSWKVVTLTTVWASVAFLFVKRSKRSEQDIRPALCFCILGFWMAWLPHAWVDRALFLYHFLPPLLYGLLGTALFLDRIFGSERKGRAVAIGLIVTAVVGFLLRIPATYGLTMSNSYWSWY